MRSGTRDLHPTRLKRRATENRMGTVARRTHHTAEARVAAQTGRGTTATTDRRLALVRTLALPMPHSTAVVTKRLGQVDAVDSQTARTESVCIDVVQSSQLRRRQ